MQRGDIVIVDLEPSRGSEANTRRPAVIVSNDRANLSAQRRGRGVVTVVPITSNVRRGFAFQVLLPASQTGLRADSKAQSEQIRSVDVQRLSEPIGAVPTRLMAEIDGTIRLHLQL